MPPLYSSRGLGAASNDLWSLLARAGVSTTLTPLAIPFMNMLPLTGEPEAQGVQILVQGLQRLMRERGQRIAVDGALGPQTVRALQVFAGPRWDQKSWATLYQDVLRGGWRGPIRNDRQLLDAAAPQGMGASFLGDVAFSPLGLLAIGFGIWWWINRDQPRGRAVTAAARRGAAGAERRARAYLAKRKAARASAPAATPRYGKGSRRAALASYMTPRSSSSSGSRRRLRAALGQA